MVRPGGEAAGTVSMGFLDRWSRKAARGPEPAALRDYRLPTSLIRLAAIGDIHGRADLLERMFVSLDTCAQDGGPPIGEIYLGDYIDRGPESARVIELLIARIASRHAVVTLMGNHEQMLLESLVDDEAFAAWLSYGGRQTVAAYLGPELMRDTPLDQLRERFAAAFPPAHRAFLEGLRQSVSYKGFFFVHAGVRPGVDLAMQSPQDLLWIREPFHSHGGDFGALIVHGHTPDREPHLLQNRICIDTGAFHTGRLTGILFAGDGARLLQVET